MKRSKRHRIKRNKISTRQRVDAVKDFAASVKSGLKNVQYSWDENKRKFLPIKSH